MASLLRLNARLISPSFLSDCCCCLFAELGLVLLLATTSQQLPAASQQLDDSLVSVIESESGFGSDVTGWSCLSSSSPIERLMSSTFCLAIVMVLL